MKLILIDDDEIVHFIFKTVVRQYNNSIETASYRSANEALESFKNFNATIDAIFLDINMPVMTGWDFLSLYEKLGFHIPVYLLSSSKDKRDVSKSESYPSVKGFFTKPFTEEMIKSVENH